MANSRISSLNSLGETPNTADIIPITDVSDTTGSAQGTTKKVTVANLVSAAPQGDLLASNNLSDVANAGTSRTNLGLGTAATTASTDYATAFYSIVTKTADYTLTNAENGKVIFCNSASRIDITIPSGLTSGFNCRVVQGGTGGVRFVASSTTINGYESGSDAPNGIVGQHGVVDIVPVGSDAYNISGEIGYVAVFNNVYSLDFDGTDDVMTATLKTDVWNGDFSISMWIKPDDVVTTFRVLMEGTTTSGYNDGWRLYQQGTNLVYFSGAGSFSSYTTSAPLVSSAYNHVVMLRTSGTLKVYVNKIERSSKAGSSNFTNTSFRVGESLGWNGYQGLIDEVAVFGYSLSQANIDTIYGGGVPGDLNDQFSSPNKPINWYRMGENDGGSGTTITDQGSEGDDATVANATFSTDVPT